ncbi:MAG: T9SS type A sorting domain-containing protein [Bacteroidetes bacterium]|nr:T9SS type A sorting domain-containing protein [Bacteroidota bacterium]
MTGTPNRLVTTGNASLAACTNWNLCTTTCAGACVVTWTTVTFNTRDMNIKHVVTVDAGYNTNHRHIGSIYIDPSASLTLNTAWPGRTSGSFNINVCGTLTVASGTSDFGNHTLTVNNGGIVNITGGELEVDKVVVKSGGTLNLNGGTLRRACGSSAAVGLTVEDGGTVNINSASSALNITSSCLSEPYTVLDGTIDCKGFLTSSTIASRFRLGFCRVTNNTSTGKIRTQTQYTPSIDWQTTTPPYSSRSANGTFTGYSSTYGGTVEYYGSSNITLDNSALQSLYQYYNLEVNLTGVAELRLGKSSIFDVVGVLYLTSGNLNINGYHLRLRGTVVYGSGNLKSTSGGTLTVVGKLSGASADFTSNGMTTYQIWAKSKAVSANINTRNPELRFVSGGRTLGTLVIDREDVTHLSTDLSITTKLNLNRGILNNGSTVLHVTSTATDAVEHNTTGTSLTGWVSGRLRRSVATGTSYDFPVGRTGISSINNATNFYDSSKLLHRRYSLDFHNATGTGYVDVNFVHPTADCEGSMPVITEDGIEYIGVHPEGHWLVNPNSGSGFNYDARLYVHGFMSSPILADNEFGGIKRPNGTGCASWSIDGGTRPAMGQPGRIVEAQSATIHNGYAKRIGWTSFSEQGIGIGSSPPLAIDPSLNLKAVAFNQAVNISWSGLQAEDVISYDLYVGHNSTPNTFLTSTTNCTGGCEFQEKPLQAAGIRYYQVHARKPDGSVVKSNVARALWHAELTIQPNPVPANGLLQVTLPSDQPANITLRNLLGQVVWQQQSQGSNLDITTPGVPGSYILSVEQDGAIVTRRVLVR